MKTILIIDDHRLFREGLRAIIERSPNYEVVGEAGNGREARRLAAKLKPDVALLDMSLPDQSGIELTRDILRCSSNTRVMVVSMHSKIDYIVGAFRAGAKGYVIKECAAGRGFVPSLRATISWTLPFLRRWLKSSRASRRTR